MKDHVFAMVQPGGCFLCSSPGFFMEVFEMNKSWLIVLVGAFFEVFWVIGLKHADNLLEWAGTLVAITASFYALIAASKENEKSSGEADS